MNSAGLDDVATIALAAMLLCLIVAAAALMWLLAGLLVDEFKARRARRGPRSRASAVKWLSFIASSVVLAVAVRDSSFRERGGIALGVAYGFSSAFLSRGENYEP